MTDEKKIGDINVKMGSGNNVEHIGHKITFHAPPPSPNAIWQDGRVVGEIGSAPLQDGDILVFDQLFFDSAFDEHSPIKVQGVKMQIEGYDVKKGVAYGRVNNTTFVRARCRLVG